MYDEDIDDSANMLNESESESESDDSDFSMLDTETVGMFNEGDTNPHENDDFIHCDYAPEKQRKKRGKYHLRIRASRKQARDLQRTQEDIEKFEIQELNRERDAVNSRRLKDARIKRQSEKRKESRQAAIPKNRTCPLCGEIKLTSKMWVIVKGKPAICKSCHLK